MWIRFPRRIETPVAARKRIKMTRIRKRKTLALSFLARFLLIESELVSSVTVETRVELSPEEQDELSSSGFQLTVLSALLKFIVAISLRLSCPQIRNSLCSKAWMQEKWQRSWIFSMMDFAMSYFCLSVDFVLKFTAEQSFPMCFIAHEKKRTWWGWSFNVS